MSALKDVIAYVLGKYPSFMKHELSNARVTKMIYLADWHQAINYGCQITDINWYFDNYGPYVDDVRRSTSENPEIFSTNSTHNMYGQPKILLTLKDETYVPVLDKGQKASLDHVMEQTQKMYWDSFIKLVYSTYPITSSERYTHLNLVEKAKEYKAQKETMAS